jgi:osmotically-inducible protein OsmY
MLLEIAPGSLSRFFSQEYIRSAGKRGAAVRRIGLTALSETLRGSAMTAVNRSASGLAATRSRSLSRALLIVAVGVLGVNSRAESDLQTDAMLEQRIEQRIAWDRELAPFRIAAEANDGVINLSGTVSTIAESHRARRIANEVGGAVGVVNGITIDPALGPFAGSLLPRPSDATLRTRIAASLAGDDRVTATGIEIQVDDGHVTLTGRVPEVAQGEHAEQIVRSLFGVRSVVNEIQWP